MVDGGFWMEESGPRLAGLAALAANSKFQIQHSKLLPSCRPLRPLREIPLLFPDVDPQFTALSFSVEP